MAIKIIKENYETWDKDINKILELIDKLELPLEADMRTQVLNKLVKIRHTINATIKDFMDLSSESRNLSSFKESLKTSYYIAVTAVAPHDITNQRYFTGKGISGEPRDAKTYDSEEAAKADFKKVPKKYHNELIRDVRVLKKYRKEESKRLKESLSNRLTLNLEDFAQEYGDIDYTDITNLSKEWDSLDSSKQREIRALVSEIRKACKETGMDAYELAREYPDDKANCDKLVSLIKSVRSKKESKRLKESYYGLFEYTSGGPENGIYCDHCDLLDVTIADSEEEAERIFNKKHDYESSYYVNEIDEAEYDEFNREFSEDDIIDVTE